MPARSPTRARTVSSTRKPLRSVRLLHSPPTPALPTAPILTRQEEEQRHAQGVAAAHEAALAARDAFKTGLDGEGGQYLRFTPTYGGPREGQTTMNHIGEEELEAKRVELSELFKKNEALARAEYKVVASSPDAST